MQSEKWRCSNEAIRCIIESYCTVCARKANRIRWLTHTKPHANGRTVETNDDDDLRTRKESSDWTLNDLHCLVLAPCAIRQTASQQGGVIIIFVLMNPSSACYIRTLFGRLIASASVRCALSGSGDWLSGIRGLL